jgi:RimJ/RimL family protein N-acetyltransferase
MDLANDLRLTVFVESDVDAVLDGSDEKIRRRFDRSDDFFASDNLRKAVRLWRDQLSGGNVLPFAVRSAATGQLVGKCQLRAAGFVEEGLLRNQRCLSGERRDMLLFSRLPSDE